jgi:UDP-glucose 4-epimerase
MKKVVVTGGAGFIGSHLAEELSSRDYHVVILDDLTTGRIENLQSFASKTNVEFVKGSITDIGLLKRLFHGISIVFHQAAIPGVPQSIADPIASNEANAAGTLNVLTAARDSGVKKVVYASSSSVYGDTPTLPKRESMVPRPQSPYAVSKLTGEYYCQVFTQIYDLPTVCLRYFNVYGPRQNPHSEYAAVVPGFISAVLSGKPPVIYGNGKQTRDFTFVKDVVSANILASTGDTTGVFNIAGGQRVGIADLAHQIIKLIGKKDIKPIYEATRPGDIKHSLADISKAETFGFAPKTALSRGLKLTIRELDSQTL